MTKYSKRIPLPLLTPPLRHKSEEGEETKWHLPLLNPPPLQGRGEEEKISHLYPPPPWERED